MRPKRPCRRCPACDEALTEPEVAGRASWAMPRSRFDLADLRGYAYYSGARFAIYAPGAGDALVRGGRYDEVGAVFGRNRPARRRASAST